MAGGGGTNTLTSKCHLVVWMQRCRRRTAASAFPLRRMRNMTNRPNRRAQDMAPTAHTGTRDLVTLRPSA